MIRKLISELREIRAEEGRKMPVVLVVGTSEQNPQAVDKLSEAGCEVLHAQRGSTALDLLHTSYRPDRPNIDLVLLVMKLEDMNALELFRAIRSEAPSLPVVFVGPPFDMAGIEQAKGPVTILADPTPDKVRQIFLQHRIPIRT